MGVSRDVWIVQLMGLGHGSFLLLYFFHQKLTWIQGLDSNLGYLSLQVVRKEIDILYLPVKDIHCVSIP